jgi:hypothetical protein
MLRFPTKVVADLQKYIYENWCHENFKHPAIHNKKTL